MSAVSARIAFALAAVLWSWLAAPASAQELATVEARVTALAGSSVYLDVGRDDHVAEGDRVVFRSDGASATEGTVRSVARKSCRAELAPASQPVNVGTRAEILIPKERLAPPPAPTPEPEVPESRDAVSESQPSVTPTKPPVPAHPAWTQPPESWSRDMPLLAPAGSTPPEEREQTIAGRVYMHADHTWDRQGEGRRYLLATLGIDMRVENPFGQGGSFDLQAETFERDTSLSGGRDESDTQATLRRFTYWFGGTEDRPNRWQLGRFLQHEFPELGVLDGVEWSHRSESGSRFGASVGAMPEPFARMDSFDDVQAAVFYRWVADRDERVALGAAIQSTWHGGTQDRSSLVTTFDYRSREKLSLHSSAWIDYYDSSDTAKSSGFELTEARVDANYRLAPQSGVGLFASEVRFPQLLRNEFTSVSDDLLRNGVVDRVGVTGWHELSSRTRVSARVDRWDDQDDSGGYGELAIACRDMLYPRGEVSLAISHTSGSFSSGPGLRVSANKSFDSAFATLGYSFADFEQKDFSGTQASLAHHALYGSVDFTLGSKWDLSLFGEDRFGDEQDAYSAGFLLQTRF